LKLRPEEITSILRQRIEQYDVETDLAEVGTVLQIGDGIARIYGLENAVAMEMLELEHGVVGLAFNLEEDDVGAALFGEWEQVSEGEPVRRSGKVASVPVGEALLGRVVDPLGNPLDGRGPIDAVAGDADQLVKNLLLLLVEKGRGGEVGEVANEFEQLAAREEGQLNVELTTAIELSEDEARQIVGQIERVSGRSVEAERKVDPNLIGGIVLQAGSLRVDASVRGRLERLTRDLVTRA